MPDLPPLKRRVLSEQEFEAIKAKVLAQAPKGLDEKGFAQWAETQGRNRLVSDIAEAEYSPAPLQGDAIQRFFGNAVGAAVNTGKELGSMVIDTLWPSPEGMLRNVQRGNAIYEGSAEQAQKAGEAFGQGRYSEAFGHGMGVIPLFTPAALAGEQIGSGDIAGGLGNATAQIGTVLAPGLIARAAPAVEVAGKVARPVVSELMPTKLRRAVRVGQKAYAAATETPEPVPVPKAAQVHPLAEKMGLRTDTSKARMAAGMSEAAKATPSAAPAPAESPVSSTPAAPPPAPPADVRTTAASAPAEPPPSPRVKVLEGDTLHLPASARTKGQMSPASIRMDVGLSAKRLKVTLTPEQMTEAADRVRTEGVSPVQAVADLAADQSAPAVETRGPTVERPKSPSPSKKFRVTRAEATEYARLMAKGMSAEDAAAAIENMRQFQAKTGSTPVSKMQRRVKQRQAAGPGGKWPDGTP